MTTIATCMYTPTHVKLYANFPYIYCQQEGAIYLPTVSVSLQKVSYYFYCCHITLTTYSCCNLTITSYQMLWT